MLTNLIVYLKTLGYLLGEFTIFTAIVATLFYLIFGDKK